MNLIETLKSDYARFPHDQTYSIYAEDIYFQDPLNKFTGIDRYQKMIQLMNKWLIDMKIDLQEISQTENTIKSRWILSWTMSLPWRPRLEIPGTSEMIINENGLIQTHIDYWDISFWQVFQQAWKIS
jgi:hypothetical protein